MATQIQIEPSEEIVQLRHVLIRARTILGNMALENEGAIFFRWPISHEPLGADAKNLLPVIDAALDSRIVGHGQIGDMQ